MADYTNHYSGSVNVFKNIFDRVFKKKKKPTYKPYTNEELLRIENVSRLPASMQKTYYTSHPAIRKKVVKNTSEAIKSMPNVVYGAAEYLNPIKTKTMLEGVTHSKIDTGNKEKTAGYQVGKALGLMGQYAMTGGGAAGAVSKSLYGGAKLVGKIGAGALSNAVISAPVNTLTSAQDSVNGKDFGKNMAINTALDLGSGAVFAGVPAIVKALKGKKPVEITPTATKNTIDRIVKGKKLANTITKPLSKDELDSAVAKVAPNATPEEVKIVSDAVAPKVDAELKSVEPKINQEVAKESLKDIQTPNGTKVPESLITGEPFMAKETQQKVVTSIKNDEDLWYNKSMKDIQRATSEKVSNLTPDEAIKLRDTVLATPNPTLESQADTVALASYFENIGDYDSAKNLHMNFALNNSNAGSVVNSGKLFQRMTPEGRSQLINNIAYKLEKEHAKQLKGKTINIPPELIDEIKNASPDEVDNVLYKASVEFFDQIPGTTLEKINAVRRFSLLFNPKTWFKNFLANVMFVPIKTVKNITATGLENVAAKTGLMSERSQALLNPVSKLDDARKALGKKVFEENEQSIMSNGKWNENSLGSRPFESKLFENKALDKVMKSPGKVLEKGDEVILKPSFNEAFARYLKANNIDPAKITTEQIESAKNVATEEALRGTFRDASKASEMILHLKKVNNNATFGGYLRSVLVESVIPFVKTPINVTRRAFDYSPIGLIGGIARIVKAANKGDSKLMIRAIDNIASGLTGTGIMTLGVLMHSMGLLNGRVPYDAKGNFDKLQGEQGYSINIGDGSYTIDWATPTILPMLVGAEFDKVGKEKGLSPTEIFSAMSDLATPVVELSMMSGVADILQSVQSKGDAGGVVGSVLETALTGYAGQFVPTIAGQAARIIDDTRRSTTSTNKDATMRALEKWTNKQKAKIPGASKSLQPYVDQWGREQKSGLTERLLENLISPGFYSPKNVTSVDKEIANVYSGLDEETRDDVLPKVVSQYGLSFDGSSYQMTKKDFTQYQKSKGKTSFDALQSMFKTDAYKAMSPEERANAIKKVYDGARDVAKIDTLIKAGKDEWKVYTDDLGGAKTNYKKPKASGIKPKDYYEAFQNVNLDGSSSISQYEAYKKLESTDFTTAQKRVMWNKYNKSWKNNPYDGGYIPDNTETASTGSGGGSGKHSSSSSRHSTSSSSAKRYSDGLATKQVKKLQTLNLTGNTLSESEVKAIIKLLARK